MVNPNTIISACERMWTCSKRCALSDDRDTQRDDLRSIFGKLATDLSMMAIEIGRPDWMAVAEKVHLLHTEAVNADERGAGDWLQIGTVTPLASSLAALASVLGYRLVPISSPDTVADDVVAMLAVEGISRSAAE